MDNTALIAVIVVLGIAVLGLIGYIVMRNRKSEELRSRFGPEYDRTLKETGDKTRAEAALSERQKRVERLTLKPLTPQDTARFRESWSRVQTRFVDDPRGAVTEADQLLGEVMSTRGYPVGNFEQQAADISVHHPRVVENYRAGHEIAMRHSKGEASTEDLRQAMIHYRTLFAELVGEKDLSRAKEPEAREVREEKERRSVLR